MDAYLFTVKYACPSKIYWYFYSTNERPIVEKLLPVLRANLSHSHKAQGHHLLWPFFMYMPICFIIPYFPPIYEISSHLLLDTSLLSISSSLASFVLLSVSSATCYTLTFCCYFSYTHILPTLHPWIFLLHLLRHHFIFCFCSLRKQSSPF